MQIKKESFSPGNSMNKDSAELSNEEQIPAAVDSSIENLQNESSSCFSIKRFSISVFTISILFALLSLMIANYDALLQYHEALATTISRRVLYYQITSGHKKLKKKKSNYATGIYGVSVISEDQQDNLFTVENDTYYISFTKRCEIRSHSLGVYTFHWLEDQKLVLKKNEDMSGMLLSTMHIFDGKLLVFNYYNGMIYEINDRKQLVPYLSVYEKNGTSATPKRIHWASIYGTKLFIGSQFALNSTEDDSFVCIYDKRTKVMEYQNWDRIYQQVALLPPLRRKVVQHHTILYSSVNHEWYFFPAVFEKKQYDDFLKNKTRIKPLSMNMYVTCNEEFTECETHSLLKNPKKYSNDFIADALFLDAEESMILATLHHYRKDSIQSKLILIDLSRKIVIKESVIPGPHVYSGLGYNFGY